ncbi:YicC family protein [Solimonas sp. K1W22B-7]|uniref:YicC/YloC family endoribonuclease n=1 Tax=Solimonas sp. K1W22B-7 TaxID=2303331 RepID=UPI000E334F42|nr:YicC/YloC family endoribonuclease [Solimonas sp. K1W22B-7]AXQ27661.1 YicC family protein [Solimonas sp. K1W22B-7]
MIRSMTGYARAEVQKPWGRISWELRSVNHRYLDLQLKMPEEFRAIENELRVLAGARLGRGKVECGLRFIREASAEEKLQLDLNRLRQLRDAMDAVAQECGPLTATDPVRLLAFPGVLKQEQADFAPMLAEARSLFEKALEDFSQTRGREGERLGQFLNERTVAITELIARVRERHPQVRDLWLQKLRARCAELGVEIEPQRLAQETALAASRLDVEEEMSRLLSHLEEVKQACARGESVGRRLDFLMQELNREANTLSSKSQDAEITRCAVEMKVIIEQMREQVQNIE